MVNVLNHRGRDPEQDFSQGVGKPGEGEHAPINYHAYAACSGGYFLNNVDRAIELGQPVVLLVRRKLKSASKAIQTLKKAKIPVWTCLKETGFHQFHEQFQRDLPGLAMVLQASDGVISPTSDLLPTLKALSGDRTVSVVPTPYPIDRPSWCKEQQKGKDIMLGTREFGVERRNHLQTLFSALAAAQHLGCRVRAVEEETEKISRMLASLGLESAPIDWLPRMPYDQYLATVAKHRLVVQLDDSRVPGQVAGDCILAGTPLIGGVTEIGQLAFPDTCPTSPAHLEKRIVELYPDESACSQIAETARQLCRGNFDFEAGHRALKKAMKSSSPN